MDFPPIDFTTVANNNFTNLPQRSNSVTIGSASSSSIVIGSVDFMEFISKTNENISKINTQIDQMDKRLNDVADRVDMICAWFELTQNKN